MRQRNRLVLSIDNLVRYLFYHNCIYLGPVRKEKEDEEESMIEEPIVLSRRASSVYQGSTGGLMLQLDMENEWDKKGLEDEPYVSHFKGYFRASCHVGIRIFIRFVDCSCILNLINQTVMFLFKLILSTGISFGIFSKICNYCIVIFIHSHAF